MRFPWHTPRPTRVALAGLLLLSAAIPTRADAGSATTTLGVTITITAGCTVSATPVAFATQSVLSGATVANGSLSVVCTSTTPYVVGLGTGTGTGATTTARKMTGPSSALVTYALFQNAAMSMNFGSTVGTDTLGGTGSGIAQVIPVYGQVQAQSSPAPGSYADTVNVTITF